MEAKLKNAMKEFEEEHRIEDIILLGSDGAVRRIVISDGL